MTAYNNLDRILSPSVCNIEIQLITQSLVNVTRGAFGFYKLTPTPPQWYQETIIARLSLCVWTTTPRGTVVQELKL